MAHSHPSHSQPISFTTVDALLDFVTLRWRENWVTTDIWDEKVVDVLLRRPFFLLVSVDAPVSVRWQRFKDRCVQTGSLSTAAAYILQMCYEEAPCPFLGRICPA